MGRCEVCGRKNNPAWRWCGEKKCLNEDRIIPRCIKCHNLMYDGKPGTCPNDKQSCVPDNATMTLLTKAQFDKKVK